MHDEPALTAALEKLGRTADGDPLRAVDALLRDEPSAARPLLDALLPAIAAAASDREAALSTLAAGAATLARGKAAEARELLVQGLAHAPSAEAAARGALHLARAELAIGNAAAARATSSGAVASILALDDPQALEALSAVLRSAGEPVAAEVVAHYRGSRGRAGPSGDARLEVLARLVRALNSSLVATAAPLNAVLEAVIAETSADRGFLMLYDDQTLKFELGLAKTGRVLGGDDFRFSTTLVAQALENASVVLVPELRSWLPYAAATSAQELGLRSALCAPLRIDRRRHGGTLGSVQIPQVKGIAGVIYVDSRTPGSFAEADARFFEALADCAAVAVRAARGAERLRQLEVEEVEERARDTRGRKRPGAGTATLEEIKLDHPYEDFVTRDAGMRSVLKILDRVVASDSNVLVRGESGTGKELVARAVHRYGARAKGPFVALDCGAVPDELIASELFGYEKGAFTGADESRAGLLERAHGGILFLDEVGEMSPAFQAALLRALQEGEIRRLGSGETRAVDVRVVAATHRDLRAMVERGEFRHDLLFRLAVVEIRLPPLRERIGDVPLLARHLLARIAAERQAKPLVLEPAAVTRLEEHSWPGNVRELENTLASLTVTAAEGRPVTRAEIDALLADAPRRTSAPAAPSSSLAGTLEEIERRAIEIRLEELGWNQARVAESLGIDRRTLYRKIRRYGIRRGR